MNGLLAGTAREERAAARALFRTGGYILTAPEVRGPVDVPSNVHSQSGRVEFRQSLVGTIARCFCAAIC